MCIVGLVASSVGLTGYFIPNIRNAEDILPDHDQIERVEPVENNLEEDPDKEDPTG
jgi:hypothetical protein